MKRASILEDRRILVDPMVLKRDLLDKDINTLSVPVYMFSTKSLLDFMTPEVGLRKTDHKYFVVLEKD